MVIRDIIILATVLVVGAIYYFMSVNSNRVLKKYASFMKLALLTISFILAFLNKDYIVVGNMAYGGRTSVMILILFEILDELISWKEKKKPRSSRRRS